MFFCLRAEPGSGSCPSNLMDGPAGSKPGETGGRAPSSQYCYAGGDAGLHHSVSAGLTERRRKGKGVHQGFPMRIRLHGGQRGAKASAACPLPPAQSQPVLLRRWTGGDPTCTPPNAAMGVQSGQRTPQAAFTYLSPSGEG